MSHSPIELKGSNFTLSVVYLYDPDPGVIHHALREKIAQAPAFLTGACVVVNVANLPVPVDWPAVVNAIRTSGLRLLGVSGCKDDALKAQIAQSGLALLSEGKVKAPPPLAPVSRKTMLVNTPVRSGQRIYAPDGDLVITRHVSAGAELIADGNIYIYGAMRGRALAGANGGNDAQLFASQLAAELISIAGVYWLSDQIPASYHDKAARVWLAQGALTIESLN